MNSNEIKIVLLDNLKLFREGLKQILESDLSIHVVADGNENERLYQLLHKYKPDILLIDEGIAQKKQLHDDLHILKNYPSTKMVFLTLNEKDTNSILDLTQKINGYLLKDMSAYDLIQAVKQIYAGYEFIY